MIGDDLNLLQIAARVLFLIALISYAAVIGARLIRRFGGFFPRRPRVVKMMKHRRLMRRM
jgi:hypothetical protein